VGSRGSGTMSSSTGSAGSRSTHARLLRLRELGDERRVVRRLRTPAVVAGGPTRDERRGGIALTSARPIRRPRPRWKWPWRPHDVKCTSSGCSARWASTSSPRGDDRLDAGALLGLHVRGAGEREQVVHFEADGCDVEVAADEQRCADVAQHGGTHGHRVEGEGELLLVCRRSDLAAVGNVDARDAQAADGRLDPARLVVAQLARQPTRRIGDRAELAAGEDRDAGPARATPTSSDR
jgi:hypothetical protein